MKNKPAEQESQLSAMRAFSLIGQLGLVVALPIVAGVVLGNWLAERLPCGKMILAAAVLLGVIGGLLGAVRLLLRETPWNR